MNKPIKPTKPTEPKEPQKPERIIYGDISGTVPLHDGKKISDVIKEINEFSKDLAITGIVDTDSVIFHSGDNDSYGSSDGHFGFNVKTTQTLSDSEFAKKLKDYNIKYKEYEEKLSKYKELMAQYEKDLKAYEKWKKELEEKQELEMLRKLQKKYKK